MKRSIVMVALLAALAPLSAQQRQAPAPAPRAPKIVTDPEAKAALGAAREAAGQVKGRKGPDRLAALEVAARAYEEVAERFAGDSAAAARANFEAAELWRRHSSLALAERDYLKAADGDPGQFGQRGLLGAADMQRRQKQLEKALATYGRAVAAGPAGARAQEARLWRARVMQALGRIDEAIAAFQEALESASNPRQIIEACNWLAKAQIAKGDLDAAARAIRHAEQQVAAAPAGDPKEADRLAKAVASMSARRALQRARDKSAKAAKDAVLLEENGGGL
ncbi:MAG: hypothetical protein Fur0037_25160 [Planctomycetota bacterium]